MPVSHDLDYHPELDDRPGLGDPNRPNWQRQAPAPHRMQPASIGFVQRQPPNQRGAGESGLRAQDASPRVRRRQRCATKKNAHIPHEIEQTPLDIYAYEHELNSPQKETKTTTQNPVGGGQES